jgi:predicted permease
LLGLVFAVSTLGLLTRFVARFTSRTTEISIDPGVLGFTLFVSLATGLLFGILPALASRIDLAGAMRQGSKGGGEKGGTRITRGLIVAQVAVSVVLLTGAGLLLASFYRLQKVDPGYHAEQVMSAEVFTNFSRYPNVDAQRRFYLPLIERLQGSPGVVSVAITNAVPLSTVQPGSQPFQIEGSVIDNPDKRPTADPRIVSSDYFRTLAIPVLQGRTFAESDDRETLPVVMINKAMMKFWEGRDPIGSRISTDNGQTWLTVVGIVGDVKQFGLEKDALAQVYVPLRQTPFGLAGRVLVRTQGDPAAGAQLIKDAVRGIDQEMPVKRIQSLEEIRSSYLATPRVTAILLTLFGALALIVTMAGLGGVIATSVAQRTQEFGLRMALGATRDTVLGMVVRQGLRLVAVGLAIGLVLAYAVTGALSGYLFDTSATDPATLAGVLLTLVATGALACLGPAFRATTVDPLVALRAD